MVEIEGENMRSVTLGPLGGGQERRLGIAGNALTTSDVHALAARTAS
jgi:hypothetical protein